MLLLHLLLSRRINTQALKGDPSRLRYLSPGMHVNTRYINSTRVTSSGGVDVHLCLLCIIYYVPLCLCVMADWA